MKVIQVGLGGFGSVWLDHVISKHEQLEIVALVDVNEAALQRAKEVLSLSDSLFFHSIHEAFIRLEENGVQPDFILNFTPSKIHREINLAAINKGIAVFSEKPLAENEEEAKEIVILSLEKRVPFVVSQNYRFKPVINAAKKIFDAGGLGKLENIYIQFFKDPQFGGYRNKMDYPMLIDMAIHHFDLIRFFTGEKPLSVLAKSWNPSWSLFEGDTNLQAFFTLSGNIRVSYSGSWSSKLRETSWDGNWNFEGTEGSLNIEENRITLKKGDNQEIFVIDSPDMSMRSSLDHFITSLLEGKPADTRGEDNLQSFKMITHSLQSIIKNEEVKFEK